MNLFEERKCFVLFAYTLFCLTLYLSMLFNFSPSPSFTRPRPSHSVSIYLGMFPVLQLKTVGVALSLRMTEHSSDLWLGFGSFVDKPVSPYINVHPSKINNPCR